MIFSQRHPDSHILIIRIDTVCLQGWKKNKRDVIKSYKEDSLE